MSDSPESTAVATQNNSTSETVDASNNSTSENIEEDVVMDKEKNLYMLASSETLQNESIRDDNSGIITYNTEEIPYAHDSSFTDRYLQEYDMKNTGEKHSTFGSSDTLQFENIKGNTNSQSGGGYTQSGGGSYTPGPININFTDFNVMSFCENELSKFSYTGKKEMYENTPNKEYFERHYGQAFLHTSQESNGMYVYGMPQHRSIEEHAMMDSERKPQLSDLNTINSSVDLDHNMTDKQEDKTDGYKSVGDGGLKSYISQIIDKGMTTVIDKGMTTVIDKGMTTVIDKGMTTVIDKGMTTVIDQGVTTGEKLFKCECCDYTTRWSGDMKNHERIHTGEKPYKCHICDYSARRSGQLKKHVAIHFDEKPYKCDICDYSTSRAEYLKTHKMKHSGDNPYKCYLCDYSTTLKQALKKHIMTHTGERPYACDVCDYSTTYEQSLKKHIMTHTGEGPYNHKYLRWIPIHECFIYRKVYQKL